MTLVLGALAALMIGWTAHGIRREPRRLRHAFSLVASTLLAWMALAAASGGRDPLTLAIMLAVMISPLLILALVVFLLFNGVTMLRKEGRSLGNLLSLLTGLAIPAAMIVCLALIGTSHDRTWPVVLALFIVLACGWAGFLFLACLAYAWLYPLVCGRRRLDFVVVHGSGLIRGTVPPLLARRVETGASRWREALATNPDCKLICSGGQGADEPRSEASAMAEYARTLGVVEGALWLEDRSATTEENLRFTRELVARRLGPSASGLAVTSSYHVLRTALLARQAGLDAQVAGAPVAAYYWPSAFLREFVAIVAMNPLAQGLTALAVCLPLPLAIALAPLL